MTEEEQEQQKKFLLLLLALAALTEDQINGATRPVLAKSMRKLRRQIQQMSPTGQFRIYEWQQIAPRTLPVLEELTKAQLKVMLPEIQKLLPEVQDAANDYTDPQEPEPVDIVPKTQNELLNTLTIAGAGTLASLFGNQVGINRYTLQMANDLDRMVRGMIIKLRTLQL